MEEFEQIYQKDWRKQWRKEREEVDLSSSLGQMMNGASLRVELVEALPTRLGIFPPWWNSSLPLADLRVEARRILDNLKPSVRHSCCQSASSTFLPRLDDIHPFRRVNSGPKVFSSRFAPVL